MKIAFDSYRLQMAHGPKSAIAKHCRDNASFVLTVQAKSGTDDTWIAVRGPESRDQAGPFWAVRVLYDRRPGVFMALALVTNTHRLFLGAGPDHWVIDLQGQIALAHREGKSFQNFQVFSDGVLAADTEHLFFYGPFGRPRWHMHVGEPFTYEFDAGILKIVRESRTDTFPLVTGPPE